MNTQCLQHKRDCEQYVNVNSDMVEGTRYLDPAEEASEG